MTGLSSSMIEPQAMKIGGGMYPSVMLFRKFAFVDQLLALFLRLHSAGAAQGCGILEFGIALMTRWARCPPYNELRCLCPRQLRYQGFSFFYSHPLLGHR